LHFGKIKQIVEFILIAWPFTERKRKKERKRWRALESRVPSETCEAKVKEKT
jgi:hypothetical protein